MNRCIWVLALLASCVYQPPLPGDPVDPVDEPPTTEPQPVAAACFADQPLVCLEFERPDSMTSSLALDGSGNGFDATRDGVSDFQRLVSPPVEDDDAVGFTPTTKLEIAQELDLTDDVTIELWAQTGFANTKLFDSSGRIYLARNGNNELECGINGGGGGQRVAGKSRLDAEWHHLACTLDAKGNLRVYVDGDVDDCEELETSIDTSRTGTTLLTGGLAGALDSVHVYRRGLSAAEICTLSGRASCKVTCPSNSPGG